MSEEKVQQDEAETPPGTVGLGAMAALRSVSLRAIADEADPATAHVLRHAAEVLDGLAARVTEMEETAARHGRDMEALRRLLGGGSLDAFGAAKVTLAERDRAVARVKELEAQAAFAEEDRADLRQRLGVAIDKAEACAEAVKSTNLRRALAIGRGVTAAAEAAIEDAVAAIRARGRQ